MIRGVALLVVLIAVAFLAARSALADSPTTAPAGDNASTQPAAATSQPANAPRAAIGDEVKVHYTGTLEDGSTFDSSRGESKKPLPFTVGAAMVVPGFDKAVRGLAVGEKKQVKLPPAEAYGERNEKNIADFPIAQFGENAAKLKVGQRIGITLRTGQQIPVIIAKIGKETITLDANHPLAGKTLIFDIELVELTKH